ncbi:MAG: biopolymer transport protein ExbB [Flavobacteriales bacterium]|jgi:biopolymer transport protein ExbB
MNNPYGIDALWQQGDMVIKAVAFTLLLMSVASWTVILVRAYGLYRLRKPGKALNDFWHTKSFGEGLKILGEDRGANPYRYLAETGMAQLDHHNCHKSDLHGHLPLADWLTGCMRAAIDESSEKLQSGLAVLASVGSTAPFVGLFGTVWGIYHALVGIGASGQASIDKVAGPVGEALIMTAFGLAVAIPAVLGYNALTRGNRNILSKLNRFSHQLHAYLITGAPPAKIQSLRPTSTVRQKQVFPKSLVETT